METSIYLDHAATTPLDREVLEKMTPYLTAYFGNADSPHAVGRKAMSAVDSARDKVAQLINASPNEIYFTCGGTEADNWAILGGARAKRKDGKNRVLISSIEHHAALFAAQTLQEEGFCIVYLPVNANGEVELKTVREAIDDKTALVCVMSANNETGVLQPIEEICQIAHEHGALFFTDAVQYAPYKQIDVKKTGVDMCSFSAHKFYGPKGAGALYIKNGVRVEKLIGGGEQERGLRGGTLNVPAIVGLAAAYEKACQEREENAKKLAFLSDLFLKELSAIDGVTRNGENALPSVLNLRFAGVENTARLYGADLKGVHMAAGSACASASVKPSHVLTAMGLTESEAKECVRISLGKDNTQEEIVRAARILIETVTRLRG